MDIPLAFPDYGVGQCINCGFLAKRFMGPPPEYHEATGIDRAEGRLWKVRQDYDAMPWCFLRIARFYRDDIGPKALPGNYNVTVGEFIAQVPIKDAQKLAFEAIVKPRNCPSFYVWQEGLTPKEHYEEFKMQQLEQRREEFESRMERDRREFEERLSGRAEQAEERRHNLVLLVAAAAVILALAEVGAAILGAGPGSLIGKLLGLD